MIEIIAFVAIAVYTCTLSGRVRRTLQGQVPPKFKGDAARYLVNLRRETMLIVGCSLFWAVKDIVEVLWLQADDVDAGGLTVVVWLIVGGWLACAAGAYFLRRPLMAAVVPSPAAE